MDRQCSKTEMTFLNLKEKILQEKLYVQIIYK